ncbi:SCO family protein [Carboxydochorda subterranea]|uniref:SCO family protein n=1 Tax=Carboxydichorda subterranea TaxID=3109565 RepID=A0ABZ1BVI3_9FIRM|nr:SCO family protein [Limnochorda sp. L945t]WRP16658.1 SCO family protein [Limnochorda sp. L945t]
MVLAGLAWFALARPLTVAPRLGVAPVFELIDQQGRTVTHRAFEGRPVLYSFFPASAEDATAVTMARQLQALQRRLSQDADRRERLRLVTVSVRPEHDDPARLAAFARRLDADPSIWQFLTGPGLAVKLMVGTGFGVYYDARAQAPAGVVYDPRYVLVDGQGLIRGIYSGPRLDAERLLRDLDLVLQEARAEGAARLAYEAAHLFLCYPR